MSAAQPQGRPRQPLISMSLEAAQALKFDQGRKMYANQACIEGLDPSGFLGDPIEELFDELVDARNYLSEFQRRVESGTVMAPGFDVISMLAGLAKMAEVVQAYWLEDGGRACLFSREETDFVQRLKRDPLVLSVVARELGLEKAR